MRSTNRLSWHMVFALSTVSGCWNGEEAGRFLQTSERGDSGTPAPWDPEDRTGADAADLDVSPTADSDLQSDIEDDRREGGASDAGRESDVVHRRDPPSSVFPAVHRLIAIGDLHGDIDATRRAFQLAGAADTNDEWVGADLTVVQMGDLIGRNDDERQVLDFVFGIRNKAELSGGRVHVIVGNHEVMGARVDNQAVGANPYPGYEGGLPDLALDDPRLQILPETQRARGAAVMAGGPYAKRFADFPTVLRVGGTVFVHGGLVPRWAQYGADKINDEVSQWLMGYTAEPDCTLGVDDGDRAVWTRQFSSAVDATDCAALEQSLSLLQAKRMVVAHTVQPAITSFCNDALWVVDVGMSRYYGGPTEVLEIVDDQTVAVLRP